jgi:hypothetical protein
MSGLSSVRRGDARKPHLLTNVNSGPKVKYKIRLALPSGRNRLFMSASCVSFRDISQAFSGDICGCTPLEPDAADYRHAVKHVALPGGIPQEIDIATILAWPQDTIPLPIDQPRTGRELQLVHVGLAFLQNVSINPGDCDIHMELSEVADDLPSKNSTS